MPPPPSGAEARQVSPAEQVRANPQQACPAVPQTSQV